MHARRAAVKLWREDWAVICPHTNTMFMGSRLGDKMFLDGDLEIVKRCDAIYMLRGWTDSIGAKRELEVAVENNLEVRYEG